LCVRGLRHKRTPRGRRRWRRVGDTPR
jgi:hypothetical protein